MKSVQTIVFNAKKDQILLVLRRDVDVWVFPGGGIDPGESPENAALREIEEETGIKASITRLVGEYTPVNRLAKHTYVYEARAVEGSPTTSSETREVVFFPLNKLPKNLFQLHRIFLAEALENKIAPIQRELSDVNYFEVFKFFLRHPLTLLRYLFTVLGCPLNKTR